MSGLFTSVMLLVAMVNANNHARFWQLVAVAAVGALLTIADEVGKLRRSRR